jgi:hypothetical protein
VEPLRLPTGIRASLTPLVILWLGLGGASAPAQTANPDSARLITRDISNFWRAIDHAATMGGDTTALIAALRDDYLKDPSPGLFDWITNRLISQDAVGKVLEAKGWGRDRAMGAMAASVGTPERAGFDTVVMPAILDNAARNMAFIYLARRHYYDAIRPNTMAVDTSRAIKDSIHAAFRRMSALYPDARYCDVYFLIGRLSSGGTTGRNSLLIGTEMNSRDASTPVDELPAWHRAVTGPISGLPHIVAHEMIHTLQAKRAGPQTLLKAAIDEGSADFLSELVSGKRIANPAYAYGDAHEAELWAKFQTQMDSSNVNNWLYQGDRTPPGLPADLGYWMGYKISKVYYDRAADKKAAVREILLYKDPKAFLQASGYQPGGGQGSRTAGQQDDRTAGRHDRISLVAPSTRPP